MKNVYSNDLPGIFMSKFISGNEFLCVIKNYQGTCLTEIDMTNNEDVDRTWSMLRINCDLLDNSKQMIYNPGIFEVLRTTKKIVNFDFRPDEMEESCLIVLLDDSTALRVKYQTQEKGPDYIGTCFEVTQIFNKGEKKRVILESKKKKKMKKVGTIEFAESSLMVLPVNTLFI